MAGEIETIRASISIFDGIDEDGNPRIHYGQVGPAPAAAMASWQRLEIGDRVRIIEPGSNEGIEGWAEYLTVSQTGDELTVAVDAQRVQ